MGGELLPDANQADAQPSEAGVGGQDAALLPQDAGATDAAERDAGDEDARIEPEPPKKAWTVLIYMAADNNLEPAALRDLDELNGIAASDDVEIVVQLDRSSDYTAEPLLGFGNFDTAKRLRLGKAGLELVSDLGVINTGDASVLREFLAWGLRVYPAERTALILWNHGLSWRGYGIDEGANGDRLSLASLEQALEDGLSAAQRERFDLLGFDACVMGQYEVARHLVPHARYYLASEELEPSHGWDYAALSALTADPTLSAQALGSVLMSGYQKQARSLQKHQVITLALYDLDAMTLLDTALAQLETDLLAWGEEELLHLAHAEIHAEQYGVSLDPSHSMHLVDLVDLMKELAKLAPELGEDTAHVIDAVGTLVLESVHGNKKADAHGIAVYLPDLAAHYDASFSTLDHVRPWRSVLQHLYTTAAQIVDRPLFVGGDHMIVPNPTTSSDASCGNGACEPAFDENVLSCPSDCLGISDPDYTLPACVSDEVACLGDYVLYGACVERNAHLCPPGTRCRVPWAAPGEPAVASAACVRPEGTATVECDPAGRLTIRGQLLRESASAEDALRVYDSVDKTARVFFRYGFYDHERQKVRLFGKQVAHLDRETGEVWASWDQRVMMLAQGGYELPVYAETDVAEGEAHHEVFLEYARPGTTDARPGVYHVSTSLETGAEYGHSLYVHTSLGIAEIDPEHGAQLSVTFEERGLGDNPHLEHLGDQDHPNPGQLLPIEPDLPLRFVFDSIDHAAGGASSAERHGFQPSGRVYLELEAQSLNGAFDRVHFLGYPCTPSE